MVGHSEAIHFDGLSATLPCAGARDALRQKSGTAVFVKLASNRPTSGWPVMLPQWATANRERQGALTQSRTLLPPLSRHAA